MTPVPWIDRRPLWLILYVVLLASVTGGAFAFRSWALHTFGSPKALEDWETWRQAVAGQSADQGPVKRRVPKSNLPPALVLMRDHFAVCLAMALLLSSALFYTLMVVIRGTFRPSEGPS